MRDRVAGGRGLPLRGPGDSIALSSLVPWCLPGGGKKRQLPGFGVAEGDAGGGSWAREVGRRLPELKGLTEAQAAEGEALTVEEREVASDHEGVDFARANAVSMARSRCPRR